MSKLSYILLVFLLLSCGHKKSPTGGKKDTTKPEILAISPQEYSNISGQNIEITFSKPIERSSIISGIYIYPNILEKKYKWDKNVLEIIITEPLMKNINYYLSLTTAIKDERGNHLKKNYLFVFASGKLNTNRISGNISYEDQKDKILPIELKLMASDSTEIYSKVIKNSSFLLEDLNEQNHILELFIDKNKNQKYDYEKEPYYFVNVAQQNVQPLVVEMVYADTVKPELKTIKVNSNKQLTIKFSEIISKIEEIKIFTDDSLKISQNILAYSLNQNELAIITTPLDTIRYSIEIYKLEDEKNNENDIINIFDGVAFQDTIPPRIISTSIRNGSTIKTLKPKINVKISELIFSNNLEAKLTEVETDENIELDIVSQKNGDISLIPKANLQNLSSYKLTIQIKDSNNNASEDLTEILFIPIIMK